MKEEESREKRKNNQGRISGVEVFHGSQGLGSLPPSMSILDFDLYTTTHSTHTADYGLRTTQAAVYKSTIHN